MTVTAAHDSWVWEGGVLSCGCGYSGPDRHHPTRDYDADPAPCHVRANGPWHSLTCERGWAPCGIDVGAPWTGPVMPDPWQTAEIIYNTHGCSCDEHPTNGATASCRAWRRRAAEHTAAALLAAGNARAGL